LRKEQKIIWLSHISGESRFDDASFDRIISTEVLEHVESPFQALHEINKILKTRGKFIVSNPNSHHIARIIFPSHIAKSEILSRNINCFDLAQWKALFAMCGFRLVWYKGWPNTWIFPRWKGVGKLLDRIFRKKERFKQFLFYDAVKVKSLNKNQ